MDRLTSRQREVAQLASFGWDNDDIGDELNIAKGTVANMLTEIYTRLDLISSNRNQRVLLARVVLLEQWRNDSD